MSTLIFTDDESVSWPENKALFATPLNQETVEYVVRKHGRPDARVGHFMSGSGSVGYFCQRNGLECFSAEIVEERGRNSLAREVTIQDARNTDFEPEFFDLIIVSPPLPNVRPKSFPEEYPEAGEFRRGYSTWKSSIAKLLRECQRTLTDCGRIVTVARNFTAVDGAVYFCAWNIVDAAKSLGLVAVDEIINVRHNSVAKLGPAEFLHVFGKRDRRPE